jgi:tetratricopeptide (TPR) repeat protein
MWWESRIDVVLAHVQHGQSKAKEALTRLDDRLGQLRSASSGSSGNHILDYSTAYVQLHRFIIEHDLFSNHKTSKKTQQLLEVLKALPSSIRSRPAVKLTLNDLETFLATRASSAGSSGSAKEATPLEQADIAFSQGKYQIACDLYEQNLPVDTSRQDDEASDRQLRYIQALTLTGQFEKAAELGQSLSSELDGTEASSSPDGLTLESKGLPRNMKAVVAKHLVPVANEATDEITSPQNPVKEKIMRRRARKREQYLKQLEEKGLYNPDRPTKPDPERWIPKHERSRSRGGGNRNRNSTGNNRSAQGGGSQRDALKLDAAARKAGIVPVSTGPSTASIQVSSGRKAGRRR